MGIRFAVDIGVASVGWAVVNDEYVVLESGVNIFPCADASKNAERRNFRQLKRLHRRRKNRVSDFEKLWQEENLEIPKNNQINVLQLRVKGLSEKLTQEELFWVLKNELLHRGISYLDDALEEGAANESDYKKALERNQTELTQNEYPCIIQQKRFESYGEYRGNRSFEKDGEIISLSNVFTTNSYKKEIQAILKRQKEFHLFLTEKFQDKYIEIFSRKRKYYEGPGNEKSRTNYGKYTLRINPKNGEYITEKNIFEKLIGKCTIYKDQVRAAGASYTAQEFNLLNDLNNLTVNNRKLTEEEKRNVVNEVKTAKSVNVKRILKKVIGEDIETLTGLVLDKNDKEKIHSFEQYNLMRRAFEKNGWDIEKYTREELDRIGEILTLNTEKAGIIAAFQNKDDQDDFKMINISDEQIECLIELRRKNSAKFSKWQNFSLKLMKEIIPDLYENSKNQMQILTEKELLKNNKEKYKEYKYLSEEDIIEQIYNPVVVRAIRITIRVVNALLKKYGSPRQIIVEMPRDKNEEEQKKKIKDAQNKNKKELDDIIKQVKEEYGIAITEQHFYHHKKLGLKLKLWKEQNEQCLYSGKKIEIYDLLNDQKKFEIDHIIPRSISFDDSRSNKVLVYSSENQQKGNLTPYLYLRGLKREWNFDRFKAVVVELNKKKSITKNKLDKLLCMENITKQDVLQGFVERNINDTRYASRVVLNALQDYFYSHEANTSVRVVRGSFTHQMRVALELNKDRDESFVHHAVDAMLMCYSQMGYETFHRQQKNLIDIETGEILDVEEWDKLMDDEKCTEIMYQQKRMRIIREIKVAQSRVKYWFKVDKKPNRGLCNQTIYGTRNVDGETYKINKLNLYNAEDVKKIRQMIAENQQSKFLMYDLDRKTWDGLVKILEEYSDSRNPFLDYEKETGDAFRKYAKKNNGPKVVKLKYKKEKVGSCIDISHKYGFEKGSRKVLLDSLTPFRTDVYYQPETKQYFLVGLKHSDFKVEGGHYLIKEEVYNQNLIKEKVIQTGQTWKDLGKMGIEFCFTFYRNDIIQYEKNGEVYTERFISRTKKNLNYIEKKPLKKPDWGKEEKRYRTVGLVKTCSIRKIRTDILGNQYVCEREKFRLEVDC